jgi:hypothetical protein
LAGVSSGLRAVDGPPEPVPQPTERRSARATRVRPKRRQFTVDRRVLVG